MSRDRIVIISPVRDEESHLRGTIHSVVRQTHRPLEWIIVDDGSSDGTWQILQRAAAEHPWIQPVQRTDRGFRQSGAGVVDAFYFGYEKISNGEWDFLGKLDADLTFEPHYFASCLEEFQENTDLGIAGGTICALVDGSLTAESKSDPKFHVRGAVKLYRRECWDAIGGIVRGPCWDSIDELHANMLGWQTRTLAKELVHHHRPAGQAFGRWRDWVKGGRGNYVSGYHPVFMFLKCLSRLMQRPFGIAAGGLLWGFVTAYFNRTPRLVDDQLKKYVRAQQVRHLTLRPSLWRRH